MTATIKQRTKDLRITTPTGEERTVTVRRLTWRPASEFLKNLIGLATSLFATGDTAEERIRKIATVVVGSDDLIRQLVTGTTALSQEELDALDFGDVLKLIEAALEINLDAETKNSSAAIVERVASFVVVSPKTS